MPSGLLYHPRRRPLIRAAAASGIEQAIIASRTAPDRVFELAGIDPSRIADPQLQIELIDYCGLLDVAANRTGDSLFGARFGQDFAPPNFGIVGELVTNSPTLGDGLKALSRYYGWIQQNSSLVLERQGETATLEYQIYDGRIRHRHQDAELSLAAFCSLIRHCLPFGWQPLEVHFEHGPGASRREYEALFGSGVLFDQGANAVLIDRASLSAPIAGADRGRHGRAEELLRAQANDNPLDDGRLESEAVLAATTFMIERQCRQGSVSFAAVARQLGLTRRRLRSRLRDRNAPFDELVSTVRRRLALRYLEESERSMTEIAFLLGYSEPSAFSRAFRAWTGVSPARYRHDNQAASAERGSSE